MNLKNRFALLMLSSLIAFSANGAPMAYSVNSDSGNLATEDSLYLIDLATGIEDRQGPLVSGNDDRFDTEGLAIAPGGALWGVDDESRTLFPINPGTGSINYQDEISLAGFLQNGRNDFGMTFSCDNSLYITSVVEQTLYKLDPDNNYTETIVGADGALGANISAIAAIGNPTRLYGLGNGQFQNGETDSPNLYSIDISTGVASLIGPLGNEAGEYNQGGLAFDSNGILWAITDRRIINGSIANFASQILTIDLTTGAATFINDTSEVGFESLAITAPISCTNPVDDDQLADEVLSDSYEPIPVLNPAGRLLAVFILLFAGMLVLRRRLS
jgi:hypothetical protein